MIQTIAQQTHASVRKVCAVLGTARSSFYHVAAPTHRQITPKYQIDGLLC